MSMLSDALDRIESAIKSKFDQTQAVEWITTHTTINNRKFSFKDHEYQERILQSEAPERVIRKCSQVGISELSARMALCFADVMRGFNQIYTLPTHAQAQRFSKTRVDPIIQDSPRLKAKLSKTVDSATTKQLGSNFLYFTGTFGENTAISVPADNLFHDEVDFSDQEVLGKFNSRLTHSPYKWKTSLSTPTVGGFGIDKMFSASKRHFNFVKCCHCSRFFYPDYFEHVHIPGYDDNLLAIDKTLLAGLDWQNAKLLCPHCGKEPDLSPKYRHWVCENPGESYIAEGFQVSPFDAPACITVPYLIERSTQYPLKRDFINFNLGLPFSDESSGMQDSDIDRMLSVGENGLGGYTFIGIDMGGKCHITVAQGLHDVSLTVTQRFAVDMRDIDDVLDVLQNNLNPLAVVVDAMPFTTEVYRFQQKWDNVYGAFYKSNASLEIYRVMDHIEEEEKSKQDLRQISINRDYAFDALMIDIRAGKVGLYNQRVSYHVMGELVESDTDVEVYRKQMKEMKRIPQEAKGPNSPPRYRWEKPPQADDHYHHSTLYAYVASKVTGAKTSKRGGLGPMFGSFKVQE